MRASTSFFCYTHHRPDGTVFYVGKGTEARSRTIRRQNNQHRNIVAKHGAENITITRYRCESEVEAFALEKKLIAQYKALGIELCNRTDGGEGSSGCVLSEDTKAKMAASTVGQKLSAEAREKISRAGKGRVVSAEARAKLSKVMKERMTPEYRAFISERTKAAMTAEVRAIISVRMKMRHAQNV